MELDKHKTQTYIVPEPIKVPNMVPQRVEAPTEKELVPVRRQDRKEKQSETTSAVHYTG